MIAPSQHGKFLTGRALYVHHNMGNSLLVEPLYDCTITTWETPYW